uniref:Uncharacterized protein n=1 Tax=Hyaloperonospora arabidopsidis (strain Emoy2) TaxID=559515 RepID=M4C3L0_HYAAE
MNVGAFLESLQPLEREGGSLWKRQNTTTRTTRSTIYFGAILSAPFSASARTPARNACNFRHIIRCFPCLGRW